MDYNGMEQAVFHDNIVVIINYRLALFGFLNYFDEELNTTVGGNYGLKDMQNAIEFIHGNAESLGGNKDLITINGESAGAWAVGALLLEPKTGMSTKNNFKNMTRTFRKFYKCRYCAIWMFFEFFY